MPTRTTRRWHRGDGITLPVPLFIILAIVLIGLAVVLWSSKRRQETHLSVTQPGELHAMIPSIVNLSQGSIDQGNAVTIFQNGTFFDGVIRDIAAAKVSVHFETYVWWTGEVCERVANALAAKAREGVEVRLLLDWAGSSKMDDELAEMMVAAGVNLEKFHPLRISNLGRMNNRDHRKIVVIDGRIGWIGGHGIAQEWTGNAQTKNQWRDTFIRVEGPVVARLQAAFCENWIEETGEVIAGERYFPRLVTRGSTPMHVAYTSPSGSVSSVQLLYYLAISSAEKELLIQNPYFLPNRDAIEALGRAVKRGVKVHVMIPGDDVTDSALVQHASHYRFGVLLDHGVRLYEYKKTLLHQKIIIVDGVWSCIGSTNFDERSFELNDEISAGMIDAHVAAQLRAAWDEDMKSSRELTKEEWNDRGLWHRIVDSTTFLFHDQL